MFPSSDPYPSFYYPNPVPSGYPQMRVVDTPTFYHTPGPVFMKGKWHF